jgi:CrcB protein
MRLALFIALAGALGALARWRISDWAQQSSPSLLPLGTMTVNIVGSFLLGVLISASLGGSVPETWRVPLATGFLGSFTTFSTFSVETIQLIEQGQLRLAMFNLLLQLSLGLVSAAGGLALGRAIGL